MRVPFEKYSSGVTINSLLPWLARAGDLARTIQASSDKAVGIRQLHKKANHSNPLMTDEDRRHTNAVTDADPAVQAYIGTMLLTSFSDVRIVGEEKPDFISAHSPQATKWVAAIDPINGTMHFKNGLTTYDIILSFFFEGNLRRVVMYQPHEERAFVAIDNVHLKLVPRNQFGSGMDGWRQFNPKPLIQPHLLTMNRAVPDKVRTEAKKMGFELLDGRVFREGDKEWPYSFRSLLDSRFAGTVRFATQPGDIPAIDAGTIGYLIRACKGRLHTIRLNPDNELEGYHKLICLHPSLTKDPRADRLVELIQTTD